MANKFWINGAANGLWNDTANWSTTEGGVGGAGVPGAGDTAIFANTVVDNCTADAAITVTAILNSSVNGLYTGTFDFDTFAVTVTAGVTWNAGTITCGSGDITLGGTHNFTGGTVTKETSKFVFLGTNVLTPGGNSLNNVDLGTAAATVSSLTLGGDLTIGGDFSVKNGAATSLIYSGYRIKYAGAAFDLSLLDTHTAINSSVEFNGAVAQTVTSNGFTFGEIIISNTHANGVIFADSTLARAIYGVGKKLNFLKNVTHTFNDFKICGTTGTQCSICSDTAGSQFQLVINEASECRWCTIKDCDANRGGKLKAKDPTNIDSGNNQNVDFEPVSLRPVSNKRRM